MTDRRGPRMRKDPVTPDIPPGKARPQQGDIPIGQQHYWLTILGAGPRVGQKSTFRCRCYGCGDENVIVVRAMLWQGNVRSCGCQRRSRAVAPRADGFKSHVDAARAWLTKQEDERMAKLYPPKIVPHGEAADPPWKDGWMQ